MVSALIWIIVAFGALYLNEFEAFYVSLIISSIWFATMPEEK